jgi:signal transduction histidine kinase
MRIKLGAVLSDLLGVSGVRILRALAQGERDPQKLAALGEESLHCSEKHLIQALTGHPEPPHRQLLGLYLDRYQLLREQMQRLEEMIAAANSPEVVREEGAAALAQTERLAEVVGQLLGRARRSITGSPTLASVDDIVAQQVLEWEPAFRREHRKLVVTGEQGLNAYTTTSGSSQVIATLLDNALVHGAGTVTIRTSQTRRSVVVEVRDEGKGVPQELVPRIFERSVSGAPGGTGLGLALARTVAAADGGQVVLVRPRPAVFALFLPHAISSGLDDPVVSGPA